MDWRLTSLKQPVLWKQHENMQDYKQIGHQRLIQNP